MKRTSTFVQETSTLVCPLTFAPFKEPVRASDGEVLTSAPLNVHFESDPKLKDKCKLKDDICSLRFSNWKDSLIQGLLRVDSIPQVIILREDNALCGSVLERLLHLPLFKQPYQINRNVQLRIQLRNGPASPGTVYFHKFLNLNSENSADSDRSVPKMFGEMSRLPEFIENLAVLYNQSSDDAPFSHPPQQTMEIVMHLQHPLYLDMNIIDVIVPNQQMIKNTSLAIDTVGTCLSCCTTQTHFVMIMKTGNFEKNIPMFEIAKKFQKLDQCMGLVVLSQSDDFDAVHQQVKKFSGEFCLGHGWALTLGNTISDGDAIKFSESQYFRDKLEQNPLLIHNESELLYGLPDISTKILNRVKHILHLSCVPCQLEIIEKQFSQTIQEIINLGVPFSHEAELVPIELRKYCTTLPNLSTQVNEYFQYVVSSKAIQDICSNWLESLLKEKIAKKSPLPDKIVNMEEIYQFCEALENIDSIKSRQVAMSLIKKLNNTKTDWNFSRFDQLNDKVTSKVTSLCHEWIKSCADDIKHAISNHDLSIPQAPSELLSRCLSQLNCAEWSELPNDADLNDICAEIRYNKVAELSTLQETSQILKTLFIEYSSHNACGSELSQLLNRFSHVNALTEGVMKIINEMETMDTGRQRIETFQLCHLLNVPHQIHNPSYQLKYLKVIKAVIMSTARFRSRNQCVHLTNNIETTFTDKFQQKGKEIEASINGENTMDHHKHEFLGLGGSDLILQAIQNYENSSEIQNVVLELIEILAFDNSTYKANFFANDGIKKIFNTTEINKEHAGVQMQGFAALDGLVRGVDEHMRAAVAQGGIERVQMQGLAALDGLVRGVDEHMRAAVGLGCLEVIFCILSSKEYNENTKLQALLTLESLVRNVYENKRSATTIGCLQTVIRLLKIYFHDVDLQFQGLMTLDALVHGIDEHKQIAFSENGLDVIHSILKSHIGKTNLQCSGFTAAISIIDQIEEHKHSAFSLGFLSQSLSTIDYYKNYADVVVSAVQFLSCVSQGIPAHFSFIESKNGIQLLLNTMKRNQSDANIQITCCSFFVLTPQINRCSVVVAGAASLIYQAMISAPFHSLIQEKACQALLVLCTDAQDNIGGVASLGTANVVHVALKNHPDSLRVQQYGHQLLDLIECKITSSDTIEEILHKMKSFPDNVRIQSQGCLALGNYAQIDSKNQLIISDLHGMEVIINAMQRFIDRPDVQGNGCFVLGHLGKHLKNVKRFLQLYGLPVLVNGITTHQGDVDVAEQGCISLRHLSCHDTIRKRLSIDGAIVTVLQLMSIHKGNASIQSCGCLALVAFMYLNEENKANIGHLGGIKAAFEILKNFVQAPGTLVDACQLLAILATNHDVHKQMIIQNEGVDLILYNMKMHSKHAIVQRSACQAIYPLVWINNQCAIPDIRKVIDVLFQISNIHQTNADVLVTAYPVLVLIARSHQQLLFEHGFSMVSCRALGRFNAHADLQAVICTFLINLSSGKIHIKRDLYSCGVSNLLIGCMRAHINNSKVFGYAVLLLVNAAYDSVTRFNFADLGVIDILLRGMSQHKCCKNVQERCILAMLNLGCCSNVLKEMIAKNAAAMIVQAMQKHAQVAVIQEYGSSAFKLLSRYRMARMQIKASGGVDAIIAALANHPRSLGVQAEGHRALRKIR
eukprot:gene5669-8970_t